MILRLKLVDVRGPRLTSDYFGVDHPGPGMFVCLLKSIQLTAIRDSSRQTDLTNLHVVVQYSTLAFADASRWPRSYSTCTRSPLAFLYSSRYRLYLSHALDLEPREQQADLRVLFLPLRSVVYMSYKMAGADRVKRSTSLAGSANGGHILVVGCNMIQY